MKIELIVAEYIKELTLNGLNFNAALRMAKEKYKKELSAPTKVTDNSAKISK